MSILLESLKRHCNVKAILTLIIVVGTLLRLWFTSGHHFTFFYDQARDAIYAGQIAHGDLMIFGPSASGTHDTIFHGVLWYYFLAPWYTISPDPQYAASVIACLSGLSLLSVYYVSKKLTHHSTTALVVTTFMAFSNYTIVSGTWLSNPVLAGFFFPWFFYFCWRYYQSGRTKDFTIACFFLGLLTQAAIFWAFWGLLPLFILTNKIYQDKQFPTRSFVYGVSIFLLTISSMIIVQLLLIHRGVLSLTSLQYFNTTTITSSLTDAISEIVNLLGTVVSYQLLPFNLIISALIFGVIIYYSLHQHDHLINYLLITLSIPLIFLIFVFRYSPHFFIGWELPLYTLLVLSLSRLRWAKIYQSLALIAFIIIHLYTIINIRKQISPYTTFQPGTNLASQLDLIDTTYRLADYQPFTFSANTNPSYIDITWHYLYSWYGQRKYGYTPVYIGPSQTGYPHADLLETDSSYQKLFPTHFTILEPHSGIDPILYTDFITEQQRLAGSSSARLQFGSLELLTYD